MCCAFLSFQTHTKLWIRNPADFTGAAKILLVCSHQCFQQHSTGGFQTMSVTWMGAPLSRGRLLHPFSKGVLNNRGCSFLWASALDCAKVNSSALLMSRLSTAAAGGMARERSHACSQSKSICHVWS